MDEYWNYFIELYMKFGIIGGFSLAFIENVFPPLPIFAIVSANVATYGIIIGFIISYIGHTVGAVFVFIFVRKIIKPRFDKHFLKYDKVSKMEKWIAHRHFASVLIILSFPMAPYSLINFAAGISNIRKTYYIYAVVIGGFFMMISLTFLGYNLEKIISEKKYIYIIQTVIVFVLIYFIGKYFEKKYNLNMEEE